MTGVSFSIPGATRKRRREPLESEKCETPSCPQRTGFVDYDDGLSDTNSSSSNDGPRVTSRVDTVFDQNSSLGPVQVKNESKPEVEDAGNSFHPAQSQTQRDNLKTIRRPSSGSQIARLVERRRIEREEFPMDEDAAFNFDLHQCADSSRAEDYARLPVERFGSSLLTAMGWDGKPDVNTKRTAAVKPRQPLLGLGARPVSNSDKDPRRRKKSEQGRPNRNDDAGMRPLPVLSEGGVVGKWDRKDVINVRPSMDILPDGSLLPGSQQNVTPTEGVGSLDHEPDDHTTSSN
jgi:hypothetical protein